MYKFYNALYEKDATGKLDRKLKVKNPWDMTNGLNDGQRKYLIEILWHINKFRISDLTESQRRGDYENVKDNKYVLAAIQSGAYFEIPPVRGNTLSRLHNRKDDGISGFISSKVNAVLDKFKEFKSAFDPRDLDIVHRDYFDKAKENYNKYPNLYKINQDTRDSILESEDVSYWETDLDQIAMNMAFESAKEVIFNDVLSTVRSVVTLAKFTSFKTG
jgi:hypothetical protein